MKYRKRRPSERRELVCLSDSFFGDGSDVPSPRTRNEGSGWEHFKTVRKGHRVGNRGAELLFTSGTRDLMLKVRVNCNRDSDTTCLRTLTDDVIVLTTDHFTQMSHSNRPSTRKKRKKNRSTLPRLSFPLVRVNHKNHVKRKFSECFESE